MTPFRVPLAGPFTGRVSAVNASDTTSGYWGTGIWGTFIWGKPSSSTTKDQRFLNCFSQTVTDPITQKKKVYCVKRPGWGTQSTPASGKKGYSILVWTGSSTGIEVISAFNTPNSTIYDGTTSLGAITGVSSGISETFVGTTATLLVSSTDSTAWYYDTGVGVMTKITSGNFPGNAGKTLAGTFAHLDGYACIMDTSGALWASDLNSVTAWTSTSFDTANSYPDKGIGCIRHKEYIIAFGTESMQFFYNAGLTPFPLAKNTALTKKIGAVSADAICQLGDALFWCGSTPQGGISVFQYGGEYYGTTQQISTPEIEAIMLLAGASNISLTAVRFYGRSFIIVRASDTTYVYCAEEKMWHQWSSTTPLWYKCAGVSQGGTMVNYAVSNLSTSGKVYNMNEASLVFTDDTVSYTAKVQLDQMNLGTKKLKFWNHLELICDREISASTITLSYSDDDFQTYITRGTGDLSNQRVWFDSLGSSRERSWVLSHSANTPIRIEAIEGTAQIGST